jgi:hypothetical protein
MPQAADTATKSKAAVVPPSWNSQAERGVENSCYDASLYLENF